MVTIANQSVNEIFERYPTDVRKQMKQLRRLILDTANESGLGDTIEETVKWGAPGYLCRKGSTVRIDWKESKPDQIAMYFNCRTKLIDTFRTLFNDELSFEGNRAIVFDLQHELPVIQLRECVLMALTYHTRKHLPLLGA